MLAWSGEKTAEQSVAVSAYISALVTGTLSDCTLAENSCRRSVASLIALEASDKHLLLAGCEHPTLRLHRNDALPPPLVSSRAQWSSGVCLTDTTPGLPRRRRSHCRPVGDQIKPSPTGWISDLADFRVNTFVEFHCVLVVGD